MNALQTTHKTVKFQVGFLCANDETRIFCLKALVASDKTPQPNSASFFTDCMLALTQKILKEQEKHILPSAHPRQSSIYCYIWVPLTLTTPTQRKQLFESLARNVAKKQFVSIHMHKEFKQNVYGTCMPMQIFEVTLHLNK